MKIIDILNKQKDKKRKGPLFSFEYFPPKTEKGVENLYDRLERMSAWGPSWIDVTWGAGGSTSELTQEICHTAQNFIGLETMMHLTCTNMPRESIKEALQKARDSGIQNILALRGDPPRGEEWKQVDGGFAYGADLVRYIRQEHGDYFGICVAGYPEGHIDAASYEEDLKHLKAKIDAGADLIITQLFYDTNLFLKFVLDCRALGITVPIIPGIMPIHGYAGFEKMTTLCKTAVPAEIRAELEPIKGNDEAVKEYGITLAIRMCKALIEGGVPALHFYTLNLEKSANQILEGLHLLESGRPLPWNTAPTRGKEDVRPIFWRNRPKSYIHRTASWDEFPNGRWGDSRSPAFGSLTDYHLSSLYTAKKADRVTTWGEPKTAREVGQVFEGYINGKIAMLPWYDSPMAQESDLIRDHLITLNQLGFFTINSQPRINGMSSEDPNVGWGPKGGYVYQKAYVEFFASPENLQLFAAQVKKHPSLTYHAVDIKGESHTNIPADLTSDRPNTYATAVTWGVFPHKEIVQPTVVDKDSFLVWKEEAFALWRSVWASLYDEGTATRKLLDSMIDSYFLVSLVDDNFVDGDIWAVFEDIKTLTSAS